MSLQDASALGTITWVFVCVNSNIFPSLRRWSGFKQGVFESVDSNKEGGVIESTSPPQRQEMVPSLTGHLLMILPKRKSFSFQFTSQKKTTEAVQFKLVLRAEMVCNVFTVRDRSARRKMALEKWCFPKMLNCI